MFVRTTSAKLATAAVAVAGMSVALVGPASAYTSAATTGDYTYNNAVPAATDLVGVGSDTIQFVMGDLAKAYDADATHTTKVDTFGACTVAAGTLYPCTLPNASSTDTTNTTDYITIHDGVTIKRPNGSGSGQSTLFGANDQPGVAYARSSAGPDDSKGAITAGLQWYPFALDTLVMVTSPNSNAPATLTGQNILDIYTGKVTDWSQLPGGKSGAIEALEPQSGSGTRGFFEGQLKALNGGTAPTLVAKDKVGDASVQEHDPGLIKNDPNAIAPFSLGRAGFTNGAVRVETGWKADRAVYNVLRSKDAGNSGKSDNSAWFAGSPTMEKVFGASGYLCSPAARSIIESAGFLQLKSVADGGECGLPTQSTSGPSLAAYSKAAPGTGTTTPPAAGPSAAEKAAVAKLHKDQKALKAAKKALKKAKGHKKVVLKKKVAKLNKAIKKDKAAVKAAA